MDNYNLFTLSPIVRHSSCILKIPIIMIVVMNIFGASETEMWRLSALSLLAPPLQGPSAEVG